MPAIKLAAFSGEQPSIVPRLLPPTAAQSAINARLDNGSLAPYRASTLATTVTSLNGVGAIGSIYKHGEDWLGWVGTINAAPGPVADDRLYYTGDGVPKVKTGATIYPLAVPAPTTAPTATPSGVGTGAVQTRIYVYTFVTSLGEESEPSAASTGINWQTGQTVTLSGVEDAPVSPLRGITKQRFYRSQTGSVGTDFYFIAERDVSNSNFVDTVAVDAFAEPLPSRLWNPPPDGLAGLIPLPNGMMAGFVGKQLYFCEPFRPHAWPEIYILTADVPIVALGAAGTTLWVLTEGTPYRVSGTSPDAMVMDKVEANLPCVNAGGVVDLGYTIAWPSNDGLAVARAGGDVGLASTNLFKPRDWQRLNPATMRASQLQGRWIGSYATTDENGNAISGSLIIDVSGDTSFLIRTSVFAAAWHYDILSGFAYYLEPGGGGVWLFDSPTGAPTSLSWRSKQFVLGKPDNFGVILIESGTQLSTEEAAARQAEIDAIIAANAALLAAVGGVGGELGGSAIAEVTLAGDFLESLPTAIGSTITVTVYADGEAIAIVGEVNRPVRLPSGFTERIWELAVFADIQVDAIVMARTMDELKTASANP